MFLGKIAYACYWIAVILLVIIKDITIKSKNSGKAQRLNYYFYSMRTEVQVCVSGISKLGI